MTNSLVCVFLHYQILFAGNYAKQMNKNQYVTRIDWKDQCFSRWC